MFLTMDAGLLKMGVLTQTATHNNQACKQLLFGLVSYVCVYMFQCLSGLYAKYFFFMPINDFPIWYHRSSLILEGQVPPNAYIGGGGGGIAPLPPCSATPASECATKAKD